VALVESGIDASTPRDVLRQAFLAGWIDDELGTLRMLEARNLTSHTYDEDLARGIYAEIPAFCALMLQTSALVTRKFSALPEPGDRLP